MGTVFRGWDPQLSRLVAIKVVDLQVGAAPAEAERFAVEARAAARLTHRAIVPVFDAGAERGQPYIVMGYVDGRSLAERLDDQPPPPLTEVLEIVREVALALHEAHEAGIVHRDVKPANILIDRKGRPFLTDFGLALDHTARKRLTDLGHTVGTPAYMSPEQARNVPGSIGPASDLWALGAILYRAACGRPPFQSRSNLDLLLMVVRDPVVPPRTYAPGLPDAVEAIIHRCLEKDPAGRYPSGEALADAIDAHLGVGDARSSETGRARRADLRRSGPAGAAGAAGVEATDHVTAVTSAPREPAVLAGPGGRGGASPRRVLPGLVAIGAVAFLVGAAVVALGGGRGSTPSGGGGSGSSPGDAPIAVATGSSDDAGSSEDDSESDDDDESGLDPDPDPDGDPGVDRKPPPPMQLSLEPGRLQVFGEQDRIRTVRGRVRGEPPFAVTVAGEPATVGRGRVASFRAAVRLEEGWNELEVVAVDGRGERAASRIAIRWAPDRDVGERATEAQRAWAERLEVSVELTTLSGIRFVLVPPGTFAMGGAPRGGGREAEPTRQVTITRPFYLGVTEVTNAEMRRVIPGFRSEVDEEALAGVELDLADLPAVGVTWDEADALGARLGATDGGRYRLPTEAEWEHSARLDGVSATIDRYLRGRGGARQVGKMANLLDRSAARAPWAPAKTGAANDHHATAAPVGQFPRGALGHLDLIGNVAEWCSDRPWSAELGPRVDPRGPLGRPDRKHERAIRGGSWRTRWDQARVGRRRYRPADARDADVGVRLVREIPQARPAELDLTAPPAFVDDPELATLAVAGSVDEDGCHVEVVGGGAVTMRGRSFTSAFPPERGENEMRVVVTDADGNRTERVVRVLWRPTRAGEPWWDPTPAQTAAAGEGRPTHRTVDLGGGVSMRFVLVPPGALEPGARSIYAKRDEAPRRVEVRRAIHLGATEVTNAQMRRFRSDHPSGGRSFRGRRVDGDEQPAVGVSWDDAVAFCEWLTGRDADGVRYRLPTEDEWESACSLGGARWAWGEDEERAGLHENTLDRSAAQRWPETAPWPARARSPMRTHDRHVVAAPVGSYRPCAIGTFDMLGNVREWCADAFPGADPAVEARVVRGGSWRSDVRLARAEFRGRMPSVPKTPPPDLGFRVVRELD